MIHLSDIQSAKQRIENVVYKSPLVKFWSPGFPGEIYLKLENLQTGGSFKIRGAGNAILSIGRKQSDSGVWTVSAGNMGLALAWWAHKLKISCTVIVPENASQVKVSQILSLGANIKSVPFAEYQSIQSKREGDIEKRIFIHPFADPAVMAGNGTIGLEILEELPDVNTVIIPYGGGGLSCGIASAIKTLQPSVKILAAEVDIAAPFTSSFLKREPVKVPYRHSFVNGIGAPFVFPEMWELAFSLLDGSIAVSLDQISSTIRLLALQNHIICEGAGAVATAVALTGQAGFGKIVCIVSGGNIEMEKFYTIMKGGIPDT